MVGVCVFVNSRPEYWGLLLRRWCVVGVCVFVNGRPEYWGGGVW